MYAYASYFEAQFPLHTLHSFLLCTYRIPLYNTELTPAIAPPPPPPCSPAEEGDLHVVPGQHVPDALHLALVGVDGVHLGLVHERLLPGEVWYGGGGRRESLVARERRI